MKANEIRIGNWISLGNRIGYIQSNYSESQYIVIDEEETQDTIESIDRFKPIELTEEWLIKFGFDKHEGKSSNIMNWSRPDLTITTYVDEYIGYWLRYYQGNFPNKTKYVHQLQNLYFALTNKELTIK